VFSENRDEMWMMMISYLWKKAKRKLA